MGRTVVGDIHGRLDELTALLATARFSADPAGRAGVAADLPRGA